MWDDLGLVGRKLGENMVLRKCGMILVSWKCGLILVSGNCEMILVSGKCGMILVSGNCEMILVSRKRGMILVSSRTENKMPGLGLVPKSRLKAKIQKESRNHEMSLSRPIGVSISGLQGNMDRSWSPTENQMSLEPDFRSHLQPWGITSSGFGLCERLHPY